MKNAFCHISLLILILLNTSCYAQEATVSSFSVPSKYFDEVSARTGSLKQKLDKKSTRAVEKLAKQESRMKRRLARMDSSAATRVFGNADEKYRELEQKLKQGNKLTQYIPYLDSLNTSLKFLDQNGELLRAAKDGQQKLNEAVSKVKELETELQKAEDIKKFLKERKQFLKDQLSRFGFAKQLKKINKQTYYYATQVNEYKAILKDPKKAEQKVIGLLSKMKVFQEFMRKNSMLASLFRLPGDPNEPSSLSNLGGLQTRAQVNQLIQQQLGAGGASAMRQAQQNIQDAQSQLDQLKNKFGGSGSASSDMEMPDFKPNTQKTKSFFKRLEYGFNIQSQKKSNFFPVTSDIGLSLGYKLNDKSVIGFGASYKMGWGNGWNNIAITHQGAGLRSFIDWKLKGSFYISGGYEMNFRKYPEMPTTAPLRSQLLSEWGTQESGLIGVSKNISLKSKLFKKTKLQLLWDFLSYRQVPVAQPVLFRIEYNL